MTDPNSAARTSTIQVSLLLACGALIAGIAVWWLTPYGIGLSPDSAIYVAMANNFASTAQFAVRLSAAKFAYVTHFPPLYPTLLAFGHAFGINTLVFSRLTSCAFFGLNTLVAGFIAFKLSNHRIIVSVIAMILFAASLQLIAIHSMAWSEPLFILLTNLGIYNLARFRVQNNMRALWSACVLLGMSAVTRYAGFAGMATLIWVVLQRCPRSLSKRCAALAIFVVLLPILSWLLRNEAIASSLTDRDFGIHVAALTRELAHGVSTIQSWFGARANFSTNQPWCWATISLWLMLVTSAWRTRGEHTTLFARWIQTSVIFGALYLALLITTVALFDPDTPLDWRLLSPLQSLVIIAIAAITPNSTTRSANYRAAIGLLSIISIVVWLSPLRHWAIKIREDGEQYASQRWQHSELLKDIEALPPDVELYASSVAPIYLYTSLGARELPALSARETIKSGLTLKWRSLLTRVENHQAAIVYFFEDEPSQTTLETLTRIMGPPTVSRAEGVLWL